MGEPLDKVVTVIVADSFVVVIVPSKLVSATTATVGAAVGAGIPSRYELLG